ncbi:MAG: sulfotransferase family protein, partial [Gaiellaceae bacterium]
HAFTALPAAPAPVRPLLVIGCHRSGTTLLHDALACSPELASLGDEAPVLWEAFHHPSRHDWSSNALGAEDVSENERRWVYRVIQSVAGGLRFLEKTPSNCLRIPYLNELFPDATFVFLRRRAADNVNALMEGWRARPRFVTYRLPEPLEGLGERSGREWSFILVPGWRELRNARLEEICARQYVACNEAILRARTALDPTRAINVAYEDLVARPLHELRRIFAEVDLRFTDEVATFAASVSGTPVNALTPPKPDKWREQNPDEIRRILPLVADTERRLGY